MHELRPRPPCGEGFVFMMTSSQTHALLKQRVRYYNRPAFIERDPVSIPHRYSKRQDIEIAGLFAAVFAWGNRTTIIRKSIELLERMDNAPHDFILNHRPADLRRLTGFVHRTFNDTDLLYFVDLLHHHYSGKKSPDGKRYKPADISLETAFSHRMKRQDPDTHQALTGFHDYFFSLPYAPDRTRKHIPTPERHSSCKRLNMFLRWMVRNDKAGVDFGLWRSIRPAQLICPLDLHVSRVARKLGLLHRPQSDWAAAVELTEQLRKIDPKDPVKFDFALFSLGVEEKF
jgi:uncharacterized protein (TIGR02757 family)